MTIQIHKIIKGIVKLLTRKQKGEWNGEYDTINEIVVSLLNEWEMILVKYIPDTQKYFADTPVSVSDAKFVCHNATFRDFFDFDQLVIRPTHIEGWWKVGSTQDQFYIMPNTPEIVELLKE